MVARADHISSFVPGALHRPDPRFGSRSVYIYFVLKAIQDILVDSRQKPSQGARFFLMGCSYQGQMRV